MRTCRHGTIFSYLFLFLFLFFFKFIIYRHDNDENIPRTPQEIFRLNRMISEKFLKRFANTNKKNAPHFIPIVPSIGNNDIYPNRIVAPGPNELLSVLHEIWSPFIPKGQHETFLNGGYYYTEVIPGK